MLFVPGKGRGGREMVKKVNKQTIEGKLAGFEPNKHTSEVRRAASR